MTWALLPLWRCHRLCALTLLVACAREARAADDEPIRSVALRGKAGWQPPRASNRSLTEAELEARVRRASEASADEVASARSLIEPIFRAVPSNADGLISHAAVSYVVHAYFGRKYGWHMKGLGLSDYSLSRQAGSQRSQDRKINLEDAASILEVTLGADAQHGLSLDSVAGMAATLERLVQEDSLFILRCAFVAEGFDFDALLDLDDLYTVFFSYGILMRGKSSFLQAVQDGDPESAMPAYIADKQHANTVTQWFASSALDLSQNDEYFQRNLANPFRKRRYAFFEVLDIVRRMIISFAPIQDEFCSVMRGHLESLDTQASGRVPLSLFYEQPDVPGRGYRFSEPLDYLTQIGAIDSTGTKGPRVLITNYVLSAGNCLSSRSYFTWCCLSKCDSIMEMLEGAIQAPVATPRAILDALTSGNTSALDIPPVIEPVLIDKLEHVAQLNGGKVPLQGRLFGQWLHFQFPQQCPYPFSSASQSAQVPADRARGLGNQAAAAGTEWLHIEANASMSQWSDVEVLPLNFVDDATEWTFRLAARVVFEVLTIIAMVIVIFRTMAGAVGTGPLRQAKKKF
eukprot:TRINITY_DN64216_c0_g1_i1.p1 TRINITY_DN64216_c0_g1~~TRINITY_DN64216_c0_g1_i1.p1  ORF type:complete len:573 (-),score=65.46 TRINITY_DN64216_c0_g1_i1:61-1779(-)